MLNSYQVCYLGYIREPSTA